MNNTTEKFLKPLKYIYRFGLFSGLKTFIKITTGKGEINIRPKGVLHPIFLRSKSSDVPTFEQIFISEEYNISIPDIPKNIIDCGANVGLATVYLKNCYQHATVIAIEPDENNFKMLEKNTEQYENVKCLKNGIWNKPAHLQVVDTLGLGESWAFMTNEIIDKTESSVKSITIDEIMEKFQLEEIDLLKIDIEGAEKELFSNNYENWLPKTKILYIELHDRYRKGTATSFFKAISQYDFSIYLGRENLICIRN